MAVTPSCRAARNSSAGLAVPGLRTAELLPAGTVSWGYPGPFLPSGTLAELGLRVRVWLGPTFVLSGSGRLLLHDLSLPGT